MSLRRYTSAIKKLQACGCIHRDFLPLVYHGVVKRSTLDMIWEKCETYFPGASPDIANGVALCFVMEKFACANFPVVYSGASMHLGGDVNKFKHRAVTNFKELPFLPDNIDEIWNKKVPKIWTGPTIWCESSIEAMTAMGREDLIEGIDYEKLYEHFVTFFYYYRSMAYSLTKNKISLFVKSSVQIIVRLWNIIIRIVNNKLLKNRHRKGAHVESNVVDIISANRYIEQEIASSRVNPFA